MQQGDENTRALMKIMEKHNKTLFEEGLAKDYEINGGILYWSVNYRSLFVVPKAMRKGVVIAAHDLNGYFSLERTISRILEYCWFKGMHRYVKYHRSMCVGCLLHKKPTRKQPGLLHPIPPGKRPFSVIHLDHIGPFETSVQKSKLKS